MSATTTTNTDAQLSFRRPRWGRTIKNASATIYVFLATALAVIPLAWVLYTVITKGIRLILNQEWWLQSQRGITPRREGGGAYHAIVGTVEMAFICAAIAVPLGILGAIFLIEYAKGTKVARAVSFMVDILSGIPSIRSALHLRVVHYDLRVRPLRGCGVFGTGAADAARGTPIDRGDAQTRTAGAA